MSDSAATHTAPTRAVRRSRLATALLVVSLAVPVATLTFEVIRIVAGGGTAGLDVALWLVPFAVAALGVVGWMILRRTANAIGWVFLVMAICVELALVGEAYAGAALEAGWSLSPFFLWLTDGLAWPAAAMTITLLFLLFPTGRLPSRRCDQHEPAHLRALLAPGPAEPNDQADDRGQGGRQRQEQARDRERVAHLVGEVHEEGIGSRRCLGCLVNVRLCRRPQQG